MTVSVQRRNMQIPNATIISAVFAASFISSAAMAQEQVRQSPIRLS
jgi:hypothetical protein